VTESVLIVGASARAAACSALRAGLKPACIDLFADADLQTLGAYRRVRAWNEIPEAALGGEVTTPGAPWMYTGAIENRPWLIERLARLRPLWGNRADVVKRARSPRFLQQLFHEARIPYPETRFAAEDVPTDGSWLIKPLASAGGRAIRFWRGQGSLPRHSVVFQRYIPGLAHAACYVGDGTRAVLLGVTQQLVGETWLHAAPFHYCASIGPLCLSGGQAGAFARLGDVLARGCGLRGLFGVDCVLCDGTPWPIEVNPRYTASVEVIELATGVQALDLHRRACTGSLAGDSLAVKSEDCVGKAIIFAPNPIIFPKSGPWYDALGTCPKAYRHFADIPPRGTELSVGAPVMSVFARGTGPEACRTELQRLAAELDRQLFEQ
jgi:predicted ATP-grasp superfamily ATP-dependent carboligase